MARDACRIVKDDRWRLFEFCRYMVCTGRSSEYPGPSDLLEMMRKRGQVSVSDGRIVFVRRAGSSMTDVEKTLIDLWEPDMVACIAKTGLAAAGAGAVL